MVFRPALLQPDFRTQNSSRWRREPKIDSPGFASNARGDPAAKSLSNVQEGGSDSDGVCLVGSRRNDPFFCDLEALVPSHPIGCIVEKTGAVLHRIKCT